MPPARPLAADDVGGAAAAAGSRAACRPAAADRQTVPALPHLLQLLRSFLEVGGSQVGASLPARRAPSFCCNGVGVHRSNTKELYTRRRKSAEIELPRCQIGFDCPRVRKGLLGDRARCPRLGGRRSWTRGTWAGACCCWPRACEPAPRAAEPQAHQRGTQRARRAPHRRRLVWHR